MSGTIHISDDVIWTSGTLAFENIVRRTWEALDSSEQTAIEEAYLPLEQGFEFIALDELDQDVFRKYCSKCRIAFEDYLAQVTNTSTAGEGSESVINCWQELLDLLRQDERLPM